MKYLGEYRDAELVGQLMEKIKNTVTRPWVIMEICGGQTHSLVKNGILDLLPPEITMVHGPGCPVCVTPVAMIDQAVLLLEKGVTICSFGDMLRVPGSEKSLLKAKSEGGDVRIVYSPLDAIKMARKAPEKEFVFFAVGFETTAPANALSVIQADKLGLNNYSILTSHVLVPPAMGAILDDPENKVQGFLAAGHVCTIMGTEEYNPLVNKYKIPVVITGFEPVDLCHGILMTITQLEKGEARLENQYSRVVKPFGNPAARKVVQSVFETGDREWRGIGTIPMSGYIVRPGFAQFDAERKYGLAPARSKENPECIAGDILRGIRKPDQCPHFGKKCNPENPLGAPMVSTEGACAAYFNYSHQTMAS
ncbi:MAG: hydrogenase formation protein HypD [Cyclobacteriaceae bacterium]|nr:hydrogenase formation protein HypD [Cyclobacteriaceae bacterium]